MLYTCKENSIHMEVLQNDHSHLYATKKHIIKKCTNILFEINKKIPKKKFSAFVKEVALNYRDNPYHNIVHAYEVLQACSILCKILKVDVNRSTLLSICALCHDIQHGGLSNNDYMSLYQDTYSDQGYEKLFMIYDDLNDIHSNTSFNEKIHIYFTQNLFKKYFHNHFEKSELKKYNEIIRTVIMSTDIQLHHKYMNIVKDNLDYNLSNMILIMKLSDLSHVLRNEKAHIYWVFKLLNEQKTKYVSLPQLSKETLQFVDVFVNPLVDLFEKKYNISTPKICLQKNVSIWKNYLVQ